MRIFCPATRLLPRSYLGAGARPHMNPAPHAGPSGSRSGPAGHGTECCRRCLPVLVHRPPRSGVSPARNLVRAENLAVDEEGTGSARVDAGRMPTQVQTPRRPTRTVCLTAGWRPNSAGIRSPDRQSSRCSRYPPLKCGRDPRPARPARCGRHRCRRQRSVEPSHRGFSTQSRQAPHRRWRPADRRRR